MKTPRLFIYAADLMRLSGKSERTCRRLLQTMKEHFGLGKKQELTYHHVSDFLKIPVDQLFPYIRMFPFVISGYTP
jgi:hypothetical protein